MKRAMMKLPTLALLTALSLPMMQSCVSQSELSSAVASAKQDGIEIGYDNGYQDGHVKGFEEGKTKGFQEGYVKGLQEGSSLDVVTAYNKGYSAGDTAGYGRGLSHGYDDGYNKGFDDGYDDGFGDGRDVGFNEGYNLGYNKGNNDGYNIGFGDGYNDGYLDGDAIGYHDGYENGYDDGWYDGYDVGYDDGWFDAGGFSSKLGSVNAATTLASSMMNKLVDLKSLKSPKEVLADASVQAELAKATAGITSDSVAKKAILANYFVSSVQSKLEKDFGLSKDRSLSIARLANKIVSTASHRELVSGDTNSMAVEVLGSNLESIQEAVTMSSKGNKTKMDEIVKKAADVNKISVKQAETILAKLVL